MATSFGLLALLGYKSFANLVHDFFKACRLVPAVQDRRLAAIIYAPGGTEAVGISLWDSRNQADAYNNGSYGEVFKRTGQTRRGTPTVKTYDVANSTPHNIAARPAA